MQMAPAMDLTAACFLVFLSCVSAGTVCPQPSPGLNITQKLSQAELLLYGKDISGDPICSDDVPRCVMRQIQFQVFCIIRNVANFTINPIITIGTRQDVLACDATYFAYGESDKTLVVMVSYDAQKQQFDWDEVAQGESAKFVYNDEIKAELRRMRMASKMADDENSGWSIPEGASSEASCPGKMQHPSE